MFAHEDLQLPPGLAVSDNGFRTTAGACEGADKLLAMPDWLLGVATPSTMRA